MASDGGSGDSLPVDLPEEKSKSRKTNRIFQEYFSYERLRPCISLKLSVGVWVRAGRGFRKAMNLPWTHQPRIRPDNQASDWLSCNCRRVGPTN
ncbi:hypothetical protein Mal65_17180 [Crateriforma conspicua]|nr:hypothetical protein Mal65_17180 [Crateriforma conspicua]